MTIDKSKWIKPGGLFSPLKVDILSSKIGHPGFQVCLHPVMQSCLPCGTLPRKALQKGAFETRVLKVGTWRREKKQLWIVWLGTCSFDVDFCWIFISKSQVTCFYCFWILFCMLSFSLELFWGHQNRMTWRLWDFRCSMVLLKSHQIPPKQPCSNLGHRLRLPRLIVGPSELWLRLNRPQIGPQMGNDEMMAGKNNSSAVLISVWMPCDPMMPCRICRFSRCFCWANHSWATLQILQPQVLSKARARCSGVK